MSTYSPGSQSAAIRGIPEVNFNPTRHLWKMILGLVVAVLAVAGSVGGLGKLYFDRSAEASRRADAERQAKIRLHQLQFKMILSSIGENKNARLSDTEKSRYSSMLQDITYEDVKSLLNTINPNQDRRDLELLTSSNQLEELDAVTGLKWNNGRPAQIRFIKRKNPALNFQMIDVYSAPPDACNSKVIPLGTSSNATVEICESHLNERLEIIVIQTTD